MSQSQVTIKESQTHMQFLIDLSARTKMYVAEAGKTIEWLPFAKVTENGVHCMEKKDEQLLLVSKIVQNIAIDYPTYNTNQAYDILAEYSNLRIEDCMKKENVYADYPYSVKEKQFLKTFLILFVSSPYFIPGKPWIMPMKIQSENQWRAKDLSSRKRYDIHKQMHKKNIIYSLISL